MEDDYYNFDPNWDDTKPDEDDLCPNCWETEERCDCDATPDDFDNYL
jgi:hypothetical protein